MVATWSSRVVVESRSGAYYSFQEVSRHLPEIITSFIAPPHSGMSAANPAGGHGTTLKKTIKTREDPDPPPNSSYFLCHASFFSFRFRFMRPVQKKRARQMRRPRRRHTHEPTLRRVLAAASPPPRRLLVISSPLPRRFLAASFPPPFRLPARSPSPRRPSPRHPPPRHPPPRRRPPCRSPASSLPASSPPARHLTAHPPPHRPPACLTGHCPPASSPSASAFSRRADTPADTPRLLLASSPPPRLLASPPRLLASSPHPHRFAASARIHVSTAFAPPPATHRVFFNTIPPLCACSINTITCTGFGFHLFLFKKSQ